MKPRGKVNPVSVLVLLGIAGGIYWAVMYVPLYLDNLDVREAVDTAISRFHTTGPAAAETWLHQRLTQRTTLGVIGSHPELDDDGVEQIVPGLDVDPDNITFDWDERNSELTVRVEYDRVIRLKPTQERRTVHFVVQHSKVGR